MYRSPQDLVAQALQNAAMALRNLRAQVERTGGVPAADVAWVRAFVEETEGRLNGRADEVARRAEDTRSGEAIDRAWQLVRLFEAGALTRETAMEITLHTPFDHQARLDYPEDLRERLRDPRLIDTVLEETIFTFAIDGQFMS